MGRKSGLEGLVRWAEREEWAELFDEVFERHFGEMLDAYDLDFEALDDIVGAEDADLLWAWALEDFATQPRPQDGLTIVDDYLKRRGWKESATNRRHLEALRDSVVGIYAVVTVEPRRAVTLADVAFDSEPLRIEDAALADALRAGDRFAGRVTEISGRLRLIGSTLRFPASIAEELVADFQDMRDEYRRLVEGDGAPGTDAADDEIFAAAAAEAFGIDADELPQTGADDAAETEDAPNEEKSAEALVEEAVDGLFVLMFAGAFFGGAWLGVALREALGPPAGSGVNRDGEPLVFHTLRLPLAQRSATLRLRARLDDCADLTPEPPDAWVWLGAPAGAPAAAGDAAFALVHASGAEELARLDLRGGFLTLVANSAERARRAEAIVTEAAGDLLGEAEVTVQSLDAYLEANPHAARRLN
jgi:hypothetical protein